MLLKIGMITLAGAVLALAAPPPPKLIDIYRANSDLALPPPPAGFYRTMYYFAFSPDEQWIALVVGTLGTDMRAPVRFLPSTLILLPVHSSDRQPVHISPGVHSGSPHWSPDSEFVAVQEILTGPARTGSPKVYNLRGELQWTGPPSGEIAGFVRPGRLLARHAIGKGKFTGFDSFDIGTSAVTPWPAPRHWSIGAISPERHLLAVFPDTWRSKTLIVDYATGKVLQSMKNHVAAESGTPWVYFAEHGKTLCSAASPGVSSNYPICRDVDTGKTIAELKGINGGESADASAGSSRMVVTKMNDFPSLSGVGLTYSANVVWDFRRGAEIAAWAAPGLEVRPLFLSVVPPVVAISSSGRHVALQSGEELRIYELP
jgi:hypothetical protein